MKRWTSKKLQRCYDLIVKVNQNFIPEKNTVPFHFSKKVMNCIYNIQKENLESESSQGDWLWLFPKLCPVGLVCGLLLSITILWQNESMKSVETKILWNSLDVNFFVDEPLKSVQGDHK